MTKRATLISLTLLLVASVYFGQAQKRVDKGGYIIESSIKQQVDKKVKINGRQKMYASTDFRIF